MKQFLLLGSIGGLLAVMLGAFGAHGLERVLDPKMLQRFHTGVEYQFYHSFALLVVGVLGFQFKARALTVAGYAFALGVMLFSGSLYVYALTGVTAIAMLTPIGGTAFIVGWLALLVSINTLSRSP